MLRSFVQTNPDLKATLPLRLTLGTVFIAHGAQKLFGWFGGYGLEGTGQFFAQQMHMSPGILFAAMAGSGEFFGGLLILLGLFTRLGALSVAIVMLVAITQVHWGHFFLPNGMEYPLSLLGAAIATLMTGGGAWSVDAYLQNGLGQYRARHQQTV